MRLITLMTLLIAITWMMSSHQDTVKSDDQGEIIAIPAHEEKIDGLIYDHFSRSPLFCLYNTKTDSCVFIKNTLSTASQGGSRRVVQLLSSNGVNKIYLVKAGDNAMEFLSNSGIKTEIVPSGKSIRQILEMKLNEEDEE